MVLLEEKYIAIVIIAILEAMEGCYEAQKSNTLASTNFQTCVEIPHSRLGNISTKN
jgi:hypothetical protein